MKPLILVGVLFMLQTCHLYAQKKSTNCFFSDVAHSITNTHSTSFEMTYPLDMRDASISCHFGKVNVGSVIFINEMITFTSKINATVYCNVDSIRVKNIFKDDDLYYIFLEKEDYILVFYNLNTCKVKQGQLLCAEDILGTLAADEENRSKGLLELMLFKKKAIVNPEHYLKKEKEQQGDLLIVRSLRQPSNR
jgi:hypothetical protein